MGQGTTFILHHNYELKNSCRRSVLRRWLR